MYSLESKTGNTWRGIAPSAEGMGEFFGFVILFCFITWKSFDVKIEKYQFVLILIVGFGLYRTNNFAAFSSLILLIIMYYVLSKSKNKRNTIIVFICLIILILSFLIYFFNIFTYEDLSSRIIYNALQVSIFDNGATQELNEVNLNQIEIGNFEYVLNLRDDQKNLSSSLEYLLNRRVYGSNIDNVPNVFSIISFASFFINRSEKWGIFVAKYNPQNLEELLFGYGPAQFSSYYLEHDTLVNSGLVLPHSSVLNYLIFIGLAGVVSGLTFSFFVLHKNKAQLEVYILISFLLLNIVKSDALLYLPNILLCLLVGQFYRYSKNKGNLKV